MKFVYLLIVITLLSLITTRRLKTHRHKNKGSVGIICAISHETIEKAQKRYLPPTLDIVKKMKIPDQHQTIEGSVFNTYVDIVNISVNLEQVASKNVKVTFGEKNQITVEAIDIKASGEFYASTKNLGVTIGDKVTILIKDLDLSIAATLTWRKLKNGKMVPHAKVTDFKANLDFDFHFSGSILDIIRGWLDSTIKAKVKTIVNTQLKDMVLPIINANIENYSETLPTLANLTEKILMDYSVIEEPKIAGQVIILALDGRIFQKGDPNDKPGFPDGSSSMPQVRDAGKGIKLCISEYTLNTGLYSAFYSSLLRYDFQTPDILDVVQESKSFASHFGLSPTNIFRNHLKDNYAGPDKKVVVRIDVAAQKLPVVSLKNGEFKSVPTMRIALSSKHKTTGVWETFMGFEVEAEISARGTVKAGGLVDAHINTLTIKKFSTLINKFLGEDTILKLLLNWGLDYAKSTANKDYLTDKRYAPPKVAGISFSNSGVVIADHVTIELEPVFDMSNLKTFTRRRRHYK